MTPVGLHSKPPAFAGTPPTVRSRLFFGQDQLEDQVVKTATEQEQAKEPEGLSRWQQMRAMGRFFGYAFLRAAALTPAMQKACENRIVFPNWLGSRTVDQIQNPMLRGKVEEVFFETSDGLRLNGWFVPPEPGKPAILYSSGNGGQIISDDFLQMFTDRGLGVMAYDYRGYGKSQGFPIEEGLYRDVEAASDYLEKRGVPVEDQIPWGYSLGGAIAADIAAKRPVRGLVLQSTFPSARAIVERMKSGKGFIPKIVPGADRIHIKLDTEGKLPRVTAPVLIIAGGKDHNEAWMNRMVGVAGDTPFVQTEIIPDQGHWIDAKNLEAVFDAFLARLA